MIKFYDGPDDKLSFDQLAEDWLYLSEIRMDFLDKENEHNYFSCRHDDPQRPILLDKARKPQYIRLFLQDVLHDIEERMIELKGEKEFQKFWDKHDDTDPHIGCYSYPMCDEAPIGCVFVMGDEVEPIGHR